MIYCLSSASSQPDVLIAWGGGKFTSKVSLLKSLEIQVQFHFDIYIYILEVYQKKGILSLGMQRKFRVPYRKLEGCGNP